MPPILADAIVASLFLGDQPRGAGLAHQPLDALAADPLTVVEDAAAAAAFFRERRRGRRQGGDLVWFRKYG